MRVGHGGTRRSIIASVHSLAPLRGLSRSQRTTVLKGLDNRERDILKRAERHYTEKMMLVLTPGERARLLGKLRAQGWITSTRQQQTELIPFF